MAQCQTCSAMVVRVELEDGTTVDVEPHYDQLGTVAARYIKPKRRRDRGRWVGHHITEDHLATHGYSRHREHAEECARLANPPRPVQVVS